MGNMVRCNYCMQTFIEDEIVYNEEVNKEYCPYCGRNGYLMDLDKDDEDK